MDAKTKASFINSVGDGQQIPCPQCNAANKAGASFCVACGTALSAQNAAPAFAPAVDGAAAAPAFGAAPAAPKEAEPAFHAVEEAKPEKPYVEPESVFAQGLPEWSLEPPQVVVRRH